VCGPRASSSVGIRAASLRPPSLVIRVPSSVSPSNRDRASRGFGIGAYLHQQLVDLAYPVALAGLLLVATTLLVRPYGFRWWPVLVPAVAMTVLDYVENIGVWTLLLDWPDTHAAVITVAGAATAVKRVLGFVAFTTPLLLVLIRVAAVLRRSARRPEAVTRGTDSGTPTSPSSVAL
jgi:hypothetical protein